MFPKIPSSGPVYMRRTKHAGVTPEQGLPLETVWRHPKRSNRDSFGIFARWDLASSRA